MGVRPRADLLRDVSSSVYDVPEGVVSGNESALQMLAGVRVIAELVQLLAAQQQDEVAPFLGLLCY